MIKFNEFNRNFILLYIANIISVSGNIIYNIVLAWWITSLTGSAKYMGYILAASLIPTVLFGFIIGVLIDKINKKKLLIITDMISGILLIIMCPLIYLNTVNIFAFIILNFIIGLCSALFKSTSKSIIPEIVKKDKIVKCNSVLNSSLGIIGIVSPVFAGIIISNTSLGIVIAFAINGLSFILSAIMESFIKYNKTQVEFRKIRIRLDLKEGFDYITKESFLIKILIIMCFSNIFLASFEPLMPLFVKNILLQPSKYYSYILTSYALGGICSALYCIFKKNNTSAKTYLIVPMIVCAITLSTLSLTTNNILILLIVFLFGLSEALVNVLFFSYIQTNVDVLFLGRVFSTIFLISMSTVPIAYLIYGYLGDYILKHNYLYSGICMILVIFIVMSKDIKISLTQKHKL